ncbi:MAG: SCP2 domain-containing protein [Acidiferrobacterales bacterium]
MVDDHPHAGELLGPLLLALERTLNGLLRMDRETMHQLAELQGKLVAIHVIRHGAPALALFVSPTDAGLRLFSQCDRSPDVTLRGTSSALSRLMGSTTPLPFSPGELEITGDIELGRRFQRIMEGFDVDWEEQASRVIGDVGARSLGNAMRAIGRWGKASLTTFREDLGEYLQEEARVLAPKVRVDAFLTAVDRLRADTDRLEARIRQLRELP